MFRHGIGTGDTMVQIFGRNKYCWLSDMLPELLRRKLPCAISRESRNMRIRGALPEVSAEKSTSLVSGPDLNSIFALDLFSPFPPTRLMGPP